MPGVEVPLHFESDSNYLGDSCRRNAMLGQNMLPAVGTSGPSTSFLGLLAVSTHREGHWFLDQQGGFQTSWPLLPLLALSTISVLVGILAGWVLAH